MRCRCCDREDTMYWKGDFYCNACRQSISDTIREDKFMDALKTPSKSLEVPGKENKDVVSLS